MFQLETVIKLAVAGNPLIAKAEGTIDESRGREIAAGAFPNPTIVGGTARGAIRDPSQDIARTEYSITLQQPFEWYGKRQARKEAAEAATAGAMMGRDEATLFVTTQTKVAFYNLLLAQQSAEIALQNVETVQTLAKAVRVRVESGEGAQFESVKADVEVLKAQQEATKAKSFIQVERTHLNALTNGALSPVFQIEGEFRQPSRGLKMQDLTTRVRVFHPTIQRLRKLVTQADALITREEASIVPDVTVFGGYAREIGREAVVAGLSVPTPLWYRRQGEIAAAMGTHRYQEAELLRAQNELTRAVEQYLQEAETATERIEVFEKGLLNQADEALRIAKLSFRAGAASLLEVLDAQRVARQIQFEYAQARRDLSVALSKLEGAVGGAL
ncbi:TolC family protein [Petrachloros mirabilis]